MIASVLRVNKTTVLKTQTALICQVRMKDAPYFEQGAMLEVVGTDEGFLSAEPGFLVTNSVVTQNKSRKYSVLLVNSTKKTLKVKRGRVVGRAESVQEAREFLVVAVAQGPTKGKSKFDLSEVDALEDVKSRVVKLVNDNAHLFASSDLDLGQTQTVACNEETGDHDPIKMRPYIIPLQDRQIVDKVIDEMLEAGVIQRSQSPWSFSLVVVSIKDGSKRLCVDFRNLNEITEKNSYPLPPIDDILSMLGKAKYFTSLDLKSGYWQVRMSDKDKEKTAFACQKGLFKFNVMPFGLANAPSVFMMLMNIVLSGLEGFACAYINDILIFSETLEQHMKNIQMVFERLEQHNLKLKLKKCQFMREEIKYLGFVIGKDGIKPNQD